MSSPTPAPVVVIGGGVVGAAALHALTRRGVPALLLEAGSALALEASGTNSGILHTGFDSLPGELETELIIASAALRPRLHAELSISELSCGAVMRARGRSEVETVAGLADNARINGVEAHLDDEGALHVPGESVTNPVAYTMALTAAAVEGGAEVRLHSRVVGLEQADDGVAVRIADGEVLQATAVANCAGLRADEVARLAGDHHIEIYPRKGVFVVFRPPVPLSEIRLAVPSPGTKGILLFPTTDQHVIAGPTAEDLEDKNDWSATPASVKHLVERARSLAGDFDLGEHVGAYAGLRPAGRGTNYLVGPSAALPGLIHAAAIRSTGLSASLGIGEHICKLLADAGRIVPEPVRALPAAAPSAGNKGSWWRRTADYHAAA